MLSKGGETIRLEPKVMELLLRLAGSPKTVVSRQGLEDALWPEMIVGEDTLARTVSKLRRALGDTARGATYIETIPKRGYVLTAPVTERMTGKTPIRRRTLIGAVVVAALCVVTVVGFAVQPSSGVEAALSEARKVTSRADDQYMLFTRAGNEAAIELYQRVIAQHPDFVPAQAGLSNALVQRVVRWSSPSAGVGNTSLSAALSAGVNETPEARAVLERATALAERAVRLSPNSAVSLKALAFSYSAQGRLVEAEAVYLRALRADADAWDVLINLGELNTMRGDQAGGLHRFERAFHAMERRYDNEPQRVGPWQAALGVLIGQTHETLRNNAEAELWYRRTIELFPLHPEATASLAKLLHASGSVSEAERLCEELQEKVGGLGECRTG